MKQLHLHNTLTRQKEAFEPINPDLVKMYACGPTVYNYIHIGNARAFVVFDLLAQVLRHLYKNIKFVRNITDIDDKIMKKAQDEGVEIAEINSRYTQAFREDIQGLGCSLPDVESFATEHVDDMIAMCERLIAAGHAYEAEGHVLFDVSSMPEYGQLSRRPLDEQIAGARVEVAPYKKNPQDFVLWKPSTEDQPGWKSPWGERGRPGWHIECSAMIEAHLGETIDIHAGGQDLIFPHHENEIAQSCCAHNGAPLARYWVHNGFLQMNSEKMSKSLGNIFTVRELLEQHEGEVLRYALLSAQYRQPLDYSDDLIQQSKASLDKFYNALQKTSDIQIEDQELGQAEINSAVLDALLDDLNTPLALRRLQEILHDLNKAETESEQKRLKTELLATGRFLGFLQKTPQAWFQGAAIESTGLTEAAIQQLVEAREQARASRNFAEADRIRDELVGHGIQLEDTDGKTVWKRA